MKKIKKNKKINMTGLSNSVWGVLKIALEFRFVLFRNILLGCLGVISLLFVAYFKIKPNTSKKENEGDPR